MVAQYETARQHAALRARIRGAFLGCMLGDAIGRPFEMMSVGDRRLGPALDRRLRRAGPWSYTDDSQMMISVAESLVRRRGLCPDDLLATLAANYDPTRGYGHGMKLAMLAVRSGRGAAETAGWEEGSKGSGGAVRVVPVACAYHHDLNLVAAMAAESADVTHAHPLGRAGAVAHAVGVASTLRQSRDQRLNGEDVIAHILRSPVVSGSKLASGVANALRLARGGADVVDAVRELGNGVLAEEGVPLALFTFLRWEPDFAGVVRNTVLAGGDTDTTAAMSGALCGALVGEGGLPPRWLERMEGGPKGVEYVRALADATFEIWVNRRADA